MTGVHILRQVEVRSEKRIEETGDMESGEEEEGSREGETDQGWRGRKSGRNKAALKEEAHPDLHTSFAHLLASGSFCFAGRSPLL